MKGRLATMIVGVVLAGSVQIASAPVASACAHPNCPWSPVVDYIGRVVYEVDRICDEITEPGCPL